MAEEKPAEEAKEAEAKPAGRSKLFLILGIVLLLGLGGGGAWYMGFLGGKKPAADEGEHDAADAEGGEHGGGGHGGGEAGGKTHELKSEVGALHALDPFIANLNDADGKRYLKATIQIEFFDKDVPQDFDVRTPQVRDLLLTLFTSKSFGEIRTPEGKTVLREEIINRVNRVLRRDAVKAVYFTEFIVQ